MNRFNPERLKQLMETKGLTQADLARKMGVSRTSVSRILRQKRTPSSAFIAALKTAFPEEPLEYFFDLSVANRCHAKAKEVSANA